MLWSLRCASPELCLMSRDDNLTGGEPKGLKQTDESRNSSSIPPMRSNVRMRQHVRNAFHLAGNSRGSLLAMPSFLHWTATPGRYCRARRALQTKIRDEIVSTPPRRKPRRGALFSAITLPLVTFSETPVLTDAR